MAKLVSSDDVIRRLIEIAGLGHLIGTDGQIDHPKLLEALREWQQCNEQTHG